jgi:hypothetical protein
MMTPDQISALCNWSKTTDGQNNRISGLLLSQLMNTDMPGVRNSEGPHYDIGDRCSVWSSQKCDPKNACTLYLTRGGIVDRHNRARKDAGTVRFFED